jgi:hypothetical protein
MITKQWVDLGSREIEVVIDGQDAVNAILEGSEEWTPDQLVRRAASNFISTLRKIPDSVIAEQSPEVRKIIADALAEQAERFR